MAPGEYCAAVTLEYMSSDMTADQRFKSFRFFEFTIEEGNESTRFSCTEWLIAEAEKLTLEDDDVPDEVRYGDGVFIPIFISIEPN